MANNSGLNFIGIDNIHNLVIYPPKNGKYNGTILKFPTGSEGWALRLAEHFVDVPTQDSIDECYAWAYDYLKKGK